MEILESRLLIVEERISDLQGISENFSDAADKGERNRKCEREIKGMRVE